MRSFLLLILLLPACSLLSNGEEVSIEFKDIEGVNRLWVPEPGTRVVNDSESWDEFWYDHVRGVDDSGNPPAPPEVDFRTNTVAAVVLETSSGCSNHVVVVREILESEGTASILLGRPTPESDTICQMIITPTQIVSFRKAESVRFTGVLPR